MSVDRSGQGLNLPHGLVAQCSRTSLYLLAPYSCVTIASCSDCEIVVGAVAGALVVTGCERVRISGTCRKLVVHSCLDCEISVATLSPAVISGDSRGLLVGPLNATYRHLRMHMQLAGLQALLSAPPDPSSPAAHEAPTGPGPGLELELEMETESLPANQWANLCDVNACLDAQATAGSPSGYALDAADASILPTPVSSVAALLPPERLSCSSVPYRSEYQPPGACPVALPKAYKRAWEQRMETLRSLQESARAVGGTGEEGLLAAISSKFLDWLSSAGHTQQLLDLVRLDAQTAARQQQQ